MLLVGLTGNIASGKSVVARLLSERGATLIDADVLARRAVERGTPAFEAIVQRWGDSVVAADGSLDRAALRRRTFGDPAEIEALNTIVHPDVGRLRDRLVADARARGDRLVFCDIPLLFERGLADTVDRVVLVDAPHRLRLERLLRDRGLSEAEARQMIAVQMPSGVKRARADYVLENTGSLAALEADVAALWTVLDREAAARAPVP